MRVQSTFVWAVLSLGMVWQAAVCLSDDAFFAEPVFPGTASDEAGREAEPNAAVDEGVTADPANEPLAAPTDDPLLAPADAADEDQADDPLWSNPRFMSPLDLMPEEERQGIASFERAVRADLGVVTPESLLPPSLNPNDLFADPFSNPIRLGDGNPVSLFSASRFANQGAPIVYRLGANVNWSGIYDTGFVSGPWSPLNIALDGSFQEHQQGHFEMTHFGGDLQFDLQSAAAPSRSGEHLHQGFVEMRYSGEDVGVRRLYGRWINDEINLHLAAGSMESLWGDQQSLPRSINQGGQQSTLLVGGVGQDSTICFRLGTTLTPGTELAVGVENPDSFDVDSPDVHLMRWPNLIGRVRITGANNWDTYQVAALMRPFGVESPATSDEDWSLGWGVSTTAHRRFGNDIAGYIGATAGDGVGNYLEGIQYAAVGPAGQSVTPLRGYGAFIGLSTRWLDSCDGPSALWSNFAYGYALQQEEPLLNAEAVRKVQEGWCNIIHTVNENAAWGIEYRYGMRVVHDHRSGDDHRIQLVLQLTTGGSDSRQVQERDMLYRSLHDNQDRGPAATTYLRRL